MNRTIAFIFLMTISFFAYSQKNSSFDKYETQAKFAVMICGLEANANILGITENKGKPINHFECVEKNKHEAAKAYQNAAASLKKQKAKDSLKNYHAALIAQLDAIIVKAEDTKSSHAIRQSSMESRSNELWNRVLIDMN